MTSTESIRRLYAAVADGDAATAAAHLAPDAVLHIPVHPFRMAGDQVGEAWFHNCDQAAVDAFWKAAGR